MADARLPNIIWRPAKDNVSLWGRLSGPFRFREGEAAIGARFSLQMAGVPEVASASTPKEDALGLLQLAAEVEHALLVQYLFSALSLDGPANQTLTSIAVQEMGHLVSVQNLLIALHGVDGDGICSKLHLGRDSIRQGSSLNPLRFVLEAISHKTLAKYVCVEQPAVIADAALRARVEALGQEAIEDGVAPHPVSALYSKILWLFQPTDDFHTSLNLKPDMGLKSGWHLTPGDFAPAADIAAHASTKGEWGGYPSLVVDVPGDAASSCALLEKIIAQGEGALAASGSHFERFLQLLDSLEASQLQVRQLPRTPYLPVAGYQPEDPHATQVTAEYTILWCRYFDLHYEQLLVDIAWLFALGHSDPRRQELSGLLTSTMSSVLQAIAERLRDLPMTEGGGPGAGPTYQYMSDDVPAARQAFITRYATLKDELGKCETAIRASAQYQTCVGGVCDVLDVDGEVLLDTAQQLAANRAQLLPQP